MTPSTRARRAQPRGNGTRSGGLGGRGRQVQNVYAPLQVGSVASGPKVSFGAARSGNAQGLTLTASQAWLDLVQVNVANTPICLPGNTVVASCLNNAPFDPNNGLYMPDPIQALSDLFVRYKLRSLRLRYAPQVPTSDTVSFALAWLNDPNITNTTYNSFTKIQGCQDSITFPAYEPWSMEIPIDDSVLRYIDNDSSDNRFSMPGQIVACASAAGAASVARKGTIYLEAVLEFYELFNVSGTSFMCSCGLVSDRASLKQRYARANREHKDREFSDYLDYKQFRRPRLLVQEDPDEQKQGCSVEKIPASRPSSPCVTELRDLRPPLLLRGDAFVKVQAPASSRSVK